MINMEKIRVYHPITLMFKLTDFCPNNCLNGKYCFSGCSPNSNSWIDQERLPDIFSQAKQLGFTELAYISTEPFTDPDILENTTRTARDAGLAPRFLVTNGLIGRTYQTAKDNFQRQKDAGFDFTIKPDYHGTGYNGIDVSVDQFHNIPAECLANTILAALEVFGPTNFVAIRNTVPSRKYLDNSNLNAVVRTLQNSGKVQGLAKKTREIVFTDSSRVITTTLNAAKFGNATSQPDDFFNWHDFRLEELEIYKDLREFFPMPSIEGLEPIMPYHKLYLNPDGTCYPKLGRFKILSGGNAYNQLLEEIIDAIDQNPLIPLIMSTGFAGVLLGLKNFGIKINTRATQDLHVHDRYLSQTELMTKLSSFVRESGIEEKLRTELQASLAKARELFDARLLV